MFRSVYSKYIFYFSHMNIIFCHLLGSYTTKHVFSFVHTRYNSFIIIILKFTRLVWSSVSTEFRTWILFMAFSSGRDRVGEGMLEGSRSGSSFKYHPGVCCHWRKTLGKNLSQDRRPLGSFPRSSDCYTNILSTTLRPLGTVSIEA